MYNGADNGVNAANELTDLITEARVRSLSGGARGGSAASAVGVVDDIAGATSSAAGAAGAADDVAGGASGAGSAAGAGRFVRGVATTSYSFASDQT